MDSKKLKISDLDKMTFCRYLATMLEAGLSLSAAAAAIKKGSEKKNMQFLLEILESDLYKGKSLGESLGRFESIFDPIFLNLVAVGETSGTLVNSLNYLAEKLDKDYRFKKRIIGAFIYPGLIFSVMVAIALILLIFVIPRLGSVFKDLHVVLPVYTTLLLNISFFMSENYLAVFALLFLVLILIIIALRKQWGKSFFFSLVSHLPLLGNLLVKIDLARFSSTLAVLIKGGIPITKAVNLGFRSLSLPKFSRLGAEVEKSLLHGVGLSTELERKAVFPQLMIQMMAIGEKSGSLDKSLGHLASFYEYEVDEMVKNFSEIIEPVLMVLVGLGVGVMVLTIIAPIYNLFGSLSIQ